MAYYSSSTLMVLVFLSAFQSVFSSVLLLEVHNYTSPPVGSRVEFHCHGPAIRQQSDDFFQRGGKVEWYADDAFIGRSSMIQDEYHEMVVDSSKYSLSVLDVSTHGMTYTYYILYINDLSVDDNKNYTCALLSADNNKLVQSYPKTLKVQFPPDQLYPQCSVDSIPNNSKSLTLKCRSQTAFPHVNLYWMNRHGINADVKLSESDGFSESEVKIPIPSDDDEHICMLNYTGDFTQIIKECKVYQPIISLEEHLEGDEAVFTCSVDAEPKSEHGVSWTSFPPLIARNETTSYYSNSVSKLTISNVTVEDNGTEITCHSKSLLGENHEKRLLIVKTFGSSKPIYESPIKVNIEPETATVLPGGMATFECVVSTHKNTYKYKWYYGETEINSQSVSDKFSIEHIPFQRLYVRNVDIRENNATVSCEVMTGGHIASAHAKLVVSQPVTVIGPRVEEVSKTDSPDYDSKIWGVLIPVAGVLVGLILIVIVIWLTLKAKRKCSSNKDHHRVHTVSETVGYVTSVGCDGHFNNEPRPSLIRMQSNMSTCSNPKMINQERLAVNLPPAPPIPIENDEHGLDALRVAKKLGELEDYEDMETVRRNFYHTHEPDEHNEYQHVIERLGRSNSHQDTRPDVPPVKPRTPEPLY